MIQNELGERLRRAREDKNLSLDEIEKATGIRKRFLQAMEEGRFDLLPGEIQVRGFLKNYANHVGLNGDEALALYERQTRSARTTAALQSASPTRPVALRPTPPQSKSPSAAPPAAVSSARPAEPSPAGNEPPSMLTSASTLAPQAAAPGAPTTSSAKPVPLATIGQSGWVSRLPAWLTLEMVLIAMAVILVACVIVLVVSLLTTPSANQRPVSTSRPTATRVAYSAPSPTVPPATPTLTPPPNITASVRTTSTTGYAQVALAATEHVWVRVTTDGQTAFEGMLSPGQAPLNWEAKEMLVVESGNGAGLAVSFNSRPVGVLGPRGQLVTRAWTPTGETIVPPKPTSTLPAPSPTP